VADDDWATSAAASLGCTVAARLFDATASRLAADPRALAALVPDTFKPASGRWSGVENALDIAAECAPALTGLPLPPSTAARATAEGDAARRSFLTWVRHAQQAQIARLAAVASAPAVDASSEAPASAQPLVASDAKDGEEGPGAPIDDRGETRSESDGSGGEGDEEEGDDDLEYEYAGDGATDAEDSPLQPWMRAGLLASDASPGSDAWTAFTTGIAIEDPDSPSVVSLAESCVGEHSRLSIRRCCTCCCCTQSAPPRASADEDEAHAPPLVERRGTVWHSALAEASAQPRSGLHAWTVNLASQVRAVPLLWCSCIDVHRSSIPGRVGAW
jgi:hypothetical protein